MPRRLARKLMLSITVIVIIVAAVSGLVNVTTEEGQLLDTMIVGGLFVRAEYEYQRFASDYEAIIHTARLGLGYKF